MTHIQQRWGMLRMLTTSQPLQPCASFPNVRPAPPPLLKIPTQLGLEANDPIDQDTLVVCAYLNAPVDCVPIHALPFYLGACPVVDRPTYGFDGHGHDGRMGFAPEPKHAKPK